ncbi:SDR family NAD(P)-dependent oxidoreductase [Microbacter margulisiae]|uniref:NAD(P)-dependent dehydrogenase (Short-subunit alcohol dehydrogenase family) n=1 Tax=Microbacter margulisiae TaxID=1350067 RepID=A0A7W5DNH2_9PORP|nr:SDR family NAD(P)-dependent oxidoreductase [Microbacter margulisiae]MBB3186001.1 NAD(P)-dependent dehydrogenase (short-subunit alcohol dehydrogenase family) [Microbacter margulisiae]
MIIITGASKGIGRYLFTRFKLDGENVIGTYNSTIKGFEEDKQDYFKVDVSDSKAVETMIDSIKESLSKIILLNCAGISYTSFAHKADIEKWERVIDVNLKGSFNMIHALLPLMREQGYGRIINFSSVIAILPTPGVSAYAASKAGLLGLTKSLAAENASKGITINAINLGYVNLGMGVNDVPITYQEKMKAQIPAGRFCNPEEVYNTAKYLIQTEYVNGTAIDINGALI